jgi:hypothetical protein
VNIRVKIIPEDVQQSIGMSLEREEVTLYVHSQEEAEKHYQEAEKLFQEWYGGSGNAKD